MSEDNPLHTLLCFSFGEILLIITVTNCVVSFIDPRHGRLGSTGYAPKSSMIILERRRKSSTRKLSVSNVTQKTKVHFRSSYCIDRIMGDSIKLLKLTNAER